MTNTTLVSQLKKGEYFTLYEYGEPLSRSVYVRGDYDRSSKRYICHKFDDFNSTHLLKGDRVVYTDFVF